MNLGWQRCSEVSNSKAFGIIDNIMQDHNLCNNDDKIILDIYEFFSYANSCTGIENYNIQKKEEFDVEIFIEILEDEWYRISYYARDINYFVRGLHERVENFEKFIQTSVYGDLMINKECYDSCKNE